MTKLFRLRRQKDETWVECHTRTCMMARIIWGQTNLSFLYEKIAEGMWRAMGSVCDEKTNALMDSLKKVYKWRCTTWWQSLHKRMMKEDHENRTRWKHKWEWHNRGNVWDKLATCWTGKKNWMFARKEHNSPEDKYKFTTYIWDKLQLPTEHRREKDKHKVKRVKKKTPRDLGPEDTTVHIRCEGPTVQLCGDSDVACTWINDGEFAQGTQYKF